MSRLPAWIAAAALLAPTLAAVGPAEAEPAQEAGVVGAQTAGDSLFPHQGNGGYDVQHYDLDLAWAATNVLTATATISARTTLQPLERFSLDLEGLRVSRVLVDGTAAAYSRVASGDRHKLVVTPATPVSGDFTTEVTYAGTPVVHTDPDGSAEGWVPTGSGAASGVVALNEPVGSMTWFPNNNTPRDKATFTTTLTVPYAESAGSVNRVATSNGVLTSTTTTATTRTYTWDQPRQQATYLAFVGIGQYDVSEGDVDLTTGTTPEWSYRDSAIPDSEAHVAVARNKLSPVLRSIERRYGPYPGASTGVVVDTVPSGVNYALETQDRPFFPSSIDQATLIHELGHQWFGNAVSPADWSDVWLNEGPATFIETQVAAELYGSETTRQTYYGIWSRSTAELWSVPAAGFDDPADLFGEQVYTRGAVALEALRGSLGDAVFTRVMRTWIETYGGRSATTAQFVALAEDVSGLDLTDFFATWIHGTTKPARWPGRIDTTTTPTLDRLPRVGRRVTVDPGAWPSDTTLTYRWSLDGTVLPGSYRASYVPTARGLGKDLTVAVTGRRPGQDPVTRTSRPQEVLRGFQVPMADPVVRGTAQVGRSLRAYPGSHANTVLREQWYLDGRAIAGADESTYTLRARDRGRVVQYVARWTRPGYFPSVKESVRLRVR